MDFGVLVLIAMVGCVVWLTIAISLRARRKAGQPAPPVPEVAAGPLRWSGRANIPLPLTQLMQEQSECLAVLAGGEMLTPRQGGGFNVRGKEGPSYSSRTVNSLLKHGMLQQQVDGIAITDFGLRARETLPTRE